MKVKPDLIFQRLTEFTAIIKEKFFDETDYVSFFANYSHSSKEYLLLVASKDLLNPLEKIWLLKNELNFDFEFNVFKDKHLTRIPL
jgi:hypothetical protein